MHFLFRHLRIIKCRGERKNLFTVQKNMKIIELSLHFPNRSCFGSINVIYFGFILTFKKRNHIPEWN